MPRSQNRRTIEVPLPLYEDLKARAAEERTTIPAVLQALITDGKSMQEWFGQIDWQLHELRREVRTLHDQLTVGTHEGSFWFKPLSTFALSTVTTFSSGSPLLARPSTLAPDHPGAGSRHLSSQVNGRPKGRGYVVPEALAPPDYSNRTFR
jgi:hypothetical protein